MMSAAEHWRRSSPSRMSCGGTGPWSPGYWWSAISTRSTPRRDGGRSSSPALLRIFASTPASTSSPGTGRSSRTAATKSGTQGEPWRTWSARTTTRRPRSRAARTFSATVLTASSEKVEWTW